MAEEKVAPRCRIHFEQNSKGAVPPDVTGEAETAQEAGKLVREGLAELDAIIAARGLKTTDKA